MLKDKVLIEPKNRFTFKFASKLNVRAPAQLIGVTQLDVGATAKPPAGAVLTPYKGCFRADYRPPLHKTTSTA